MVAEKLNLVVRVTNIAHREAKVVKDRKKSAWMARAMDLV